MPNDHVCTYGALIFGSILPTVRLAKAKFESGSGKLKELGKAVADGIGSLTLNDPGVKFTPGVTVAVCVGPGLLPTRSVKFNIPSE
jgi:hypothetical protein